MARSERPDMSGEELLADVLGDSDAKRMILTNANFIYVPNQILEGGDFYALVLENSRPLAPYSTAMTLSC